MSTTPQELIAYRVDRLARITNLPALRVYRDLLVNQPGVRRALPPLGPMNNEMSDAQVMTAEDVEFWRGLGEQIRPEGDAIP